MENEETPKESRCLPLTSIDLFDGAVEEARSDDIWQIVSTDTGLPLAEGSMIDCIDGANLLRDQLQTDFAVYRKK